MSYEGWIIWVLWGWFMVPLGIPVITFVHAVGISVLVGVFTSNPKPKTDAEHRAYQDTNNLMYAHFMWALNVTLLLGVGWIVHQWM